MAKSTSHALTLGMVEELEKSVLVTPKCMDMRVLRWEAAMMIIIEYLVSGFGTWVLAGHTVHEQYIFLQLCRLTNFCE